MQAQLSANKQKQNKTKIWVSQPPLSIEKIQKTNNTKAFHPSMETGSYAQKLKKREYNHEPHAVKKAGNKPLPKQCCISSVAN